jgi:hypothetical protein
MKRIVALTLASLVLVVAELAVTAQAQSGKMIKVEIPFSFTLGKQTFPAGYYTILQPRQDLMVLRDSRGYVIDQILTQNIDARPPVTSPKLKFHFSDGQYVLSEVLREEETSSQLPTPSKHKASVQDSSTAMLGENMAGGQR